MLFRQDDLRAIADGRTLKALGLTKSLEVGYRLSPRGEVVLAAILADREC